MGKEMIERIALEVAGEMPQGFIWFEGCGHEAGVIKSEVRDFAHRFLARIDAERGKGAIGYIEKHMIEQIKEFGFAHVEVSNINHSSSRVPLFLSMTIPEGMALVPVEATKAMRAAGDAWINSCDSYDAVTIYEAMLAAAQGERNAD